MIFISWELRDNAIIVSKTIYYKQKIKRSENKGLQLKLSIRIAYANWPSVLFFFFDGRRQENKSSPRMTRWSILVYATERTRFPCPRVDVRKFTLSEIVKSSETYDILYT